MRGKPGTTLQERIRLARLVWRTAAREGNEADQLSEKEIASLLWIIAVFYRSDRRAPSVVVVPVAALYLLAIFLPLVLRSLGIRFLPPVYVAGSMVVLVAGVLLGWYSFYCRAIRVLNRVDDAAAIGPLLEALGSVGQETRAASTGALARIVDKLSCPEVASMQDRHSSMLLKRIECDNPALATSILTKVSLFDAASALPHVEALARHVSDGNGPYDDLISHARKLLPGLRERAETERLGANLLRPSALTPEADLLRPAAGTAADDSLLLRPNVSHPPVHSEG